MIPTPMQYLTTHAIAFVAGAVSLIAFRIYGNCMRASGARSVARPSDRAS